MVPARSPGNRVALRSLVAVLKGLDHHLVDSEAAERAVAAVAGKAVPAFLNRVCLHESRRRRRSLFALLGAVEPRGAA